MKEKELNEWRANVLMCEGEYNNSIRGVCEPPPSNVVRLSV